MWLHSKFEASLGYISSHKKKLEFWSNRGAVGIGARGAKQAEHSDEEGFRGIKGRSGSCLLSVSEIPALNNTLSFLRTAPTHSQPGER